ncbi:MAG: oxidoreductase-like domain-containing protein [Hyphomonadaceae bacterium]
MSETPITWPAPPNKPEPFECCGRGCCPCIFDYYWDALARWEELVRKAGGDPDEVLKLLGRER